MRDLYKEAANVVRFALNKEKSIRSAVYASKYRNKKQLLRLCCQAIRRRDVLNRILEIKELKELLNKPIFDQFILYVLLYDHIFGPGLQKAKKIYSDPILKRKAYIEQQLSTMRDIINDINEDDAQTSGTNLIPRYARINTLKWSIEEAVQALKNEEWNVSTMEPQDDEDWYRNAVSSMQENQVYIDYHVKGLLLFAPNTDLHQHWMVMDGYLLLQDKASCLSSQILKPKAGAHIFDVCAAPGMKATHLAAIVQNEGKIWATDKAKDRVQTLQAVVNKAGATNVAIYCGDFLRTDVTNEKFNKVLYALVDPPCSGSGIVKRMDEFIDGAKEKNDKRLRSLANLQAMLLKHTMKLPNVKKIVYSTCSIYEEENEKVIEEIVNDEFLKTQFKLIHAMPTWPQRGKSSYSFGEKCLRAVPETNLTNGFFIAVFKRRKMINTE